MRIGLISDTHGRLRPSVLQLFDGVDLILHAGDIGVEDVITELEAVAAVKAVHGNTDSWSLCEKHPAEQHLTLAGRHVVVVHGHVLGSPTPPALRQRYPDADIIVFGHTHKPEVDRTGGRLVVNPGAAGPARFRLKPSVAILDLSGTAPELTEISLAD